MTDLAEIEAALKAATPGPWEAVHSQTLDWLSMSPRINSEGHEPGSRIVHDGDSVMSSLWPNRNAAADAYLIVLLRNTASELLERVKAAEGMLDSVTRQLEQAVDERNYRISERNAAEATIARVRALAEEHPGTAWNSGLNLRQALRDALGGTPTDATGGASSADDERNRFSGGVCRCRACNPGATWMVVCSICGNKRCPHAWSHENRCTGSNEPDQASEPILPPTAQRYEPPADDHESGCCR